MDVVVGQTLKQIYTYFYQQLVVLNITVLPTPDNVASVVSTVGLTVYQNCPEHIQLYYDKFVSLPVQSNIIPVFLALVVLYSLFSLILVTLRGIFRLVYSFVRFTLILFMITILIYIAQQYLAQGSPLLQNILDTLVQLRQQNTSPPTSTFVVQH
ncbi:uncharacterized protein BX664DRAFT_322706 [Halteromyces radiatus]|uniref:uncharacterized protein n=1 Tax=Halteromyces radiatus TaxID=101107 RepID=UPI00221FC512|nr:uncharacterized protein BX664DRAFT_322706 [Halteromyces radiatus]KAI8100035.1 hypothetical protein BX664DRAFT_322706 [Halteromyces radiatus]